MVGGTATGEHELKNSQILVPYTQDLAMFMACNILERCDTIFEMMYTRKWWALLKTILS